MTRPRDPRAETWPPASYTLLAFVPFTTTWLCHSAHAETIPAGDAARTCLRINDNPIEGDWDERAKIRETWVAACRQAAAAEPANLRLKHVLARSLMATGRRDEAIILWRELAEHDDADATEAAELGEPGAVAALVDLKLSQNAQFRDKQGGCALAARAAKEGSKDGDAASARWRAECGAN